MPEIDSDKVCYIVAKGREFEVHESPAGPEYAADPEEEKLDEESAAPTGDPTFEELKTFINGLNWDEQIQLVALAWTGRGDFTKDEWDDALAEAERAHNEHTAEYLLGMPLLPDYLEEGLSQFDLSCEGSTMGGL
jgi:hypothetical protein